jgi:hypothetical protein
VTVTAPIPAGRQPEDGLPGMETSFRFLAVKGSPYITQALAYGASIISNPNALPVVAVLLNGASLKFRLVDSTSVAVSPPIPFEAGRVEVRYLAPAMPATPLRQPIAPPPEAFGLCPPNNERPST